MGAGHPAQAAVRRAVREALAALDGPMVLAAVSGGADSLALAAALAAEADAAGVRAGAVIVDHGLAEGSAQVAARAAGQCRALGLDPVEVAAVEVERTSAGLEADARRARYAALDAAAEQMARGMVDPAGDPKGPGGAHDGVVILLGHTRDDQAEQVLLGLARGSGARSLAGMPARRGRYLRPLLTVDRATTESACAAWELTPWRDPMNDDPGYARVRARRALLDLERDLGPGIAEALTRSADQLRADADHLDHLAEAAAAPFIRGISPSPVTAEYIEPTEGGIAVDDLLALPAAIRTRAWRRLLIAAGAPAGRLTARHVAACDALLTAYRGQGPLHLPGPLHVSRRRIGRAARVFIAPAPPVE